MTPITPNALKQWMDFYMENHLGPQDTSAHNGFNPTQFDHGGIATDFALRMLNPQPQGQQEPDFFGMLPQGQNGFAGQPGQPQGGQAPFSPMQPQAGYNRLAQLMGRR